MELAEKQRTKIALAEALGSCLCLLARRSGYLLFPSLLDHNFNELARAAFIRGGQFVQMLTRLRLYIQGNSDWSFLGSWTHGSFVRQKCDLVKFLLHSYFDRTKCINNNHLCQ